MSTVIPRVEPQFVFLSELGGEKRLFQNRVKPLKSPQLKLVD